MVPRFAQDGNLDLITTALITGFELSGSRLFVGVMLLEPAVCIEFDGSHLRASQAYLLVLVRESG